jgi:hypothetical protein
MLLAALPVQQSVASSAYSEKLDVFIAGSNAYWYFTFTGVNGSSKLAQFESSPGLSWYNVTAVMTTAWKSDFQIFGPEGYNLLPVPFIPSQGLFLNLSSDSFSDALAAAGRLDSYLLSSFVSLSNGTGSYEFYSSVSFADVVPSTLLTMVPSSMGGFGAAIGTSGFDSTLSPFVTLEGTKSPSGFSHSLVVGSISNESLNSQSRPNLLAYFGTKVTSLTAANKSSSSTIQVRVLDGVLSSTDNATVTNDAARSTGLYNLTVAPSKKVFGINATVLQQPVQLLSVRSVDVGVLRTNQAMSVTISLTDLSNTTALDNVTFNDNWWNPSLFRLVRGNSTFSLASMTASQTVTSTYVLQYIGNITGSVTIPSRAVQFTYAVGESTFKGHSWLNPITISLGRDDAVVFAYITPNGGIAEPVGATLSLKLVVTNVGTRTASSVEVNNSLITSGLKPDGGNITFPLSQTTNRLDVTNVTKVYHVTYFGVNGTQLAATTNSLSQEFTHSEMDLGFATLVVGANLAPKKAGSTAIGLTLSFAVANTGSTSVDHFIAEGTVPSGIGCGIVNGTGITCAADRLSLNYTLLAAGSTETTNMKVNVTDSSNYFIPSLSFRGVTAGISFTGESNAFAVPTGYVLTKQFSPSLLFPGANSTVTLLAVNRGPFYVYNDSISSGADSFDIISPSAVSSASNSSVAPGNNLSASYEVTASAVYGNHTSARVASNFFFGGTDFSLEGLGPYVQVYQPLNLTITTKPSAPREGKGFDFVLTFHNLAAVDVSNVLFTLPVQSGLALSRLVNATVSSGVLTVSIPSVPAHTDYNATGVAVAGSETTVSLDKAKLTFMYEGQTIKGTVPTEGIVVGVDVTTRYLIPIAVTVVALLAVAIYVRRMAASTVPASPR